MNLADIVILGDMFQIDSAELNIYFLTSGMNKIINKANADDGSYLDKQKITLPGKEFI